MTLHCSLQLKNVCNFASLYRIFLVRVGDRLFEPFLQFPDAQMLL